MNAALDAVDDASFAERVLGSQLPALVLFSAVACQPCRMIERWLPAVGRELGGRLTIVRCPVEHSPQVIHRYHITSVPTLLLFSAGAPVAEHVGLWPVPAIRDWLQDALRQIEGTCGCPGGPRTRRGFWRRFFNSEAEA